MTKTRLTDRKRAAIIEAAISEFQQSGFDATSMDKVSQQAAVSKRTLYNHFASKEALFASCLDTLWNNCVNEENFRYSPSVPVRDQLLTMVKAKIAMLQEASFQNLVRVALAGALHSPERAKSIVEEISHKEEGLHRWIEAAQGDGRLKAVAPAFAAMQLSSLIKGFAFWPQLTLGQPNLSAGECEQVAESTVTMFLACYGL
ncbi:TetR/AcrR family transcriptional regulator [Gallaecimonas mangrovi]|uniref:TetR/AcrR family transcriptional regulator n=1 Tax=Gallaecimonas mangrovi TaxID=2291597 RepID=UPI000E1FBB0B|nr:TetR/AcrR family transcriptional regulator [Gallaecimonas mangrovi]